VRTEGPSFAAALSGRKNALIAEWLRQMLQTWPETSVKFLFHEQDPFRNPVGNTLKEGLSVLFDSLVRPAVIVPAAQEALDGIIRIRAVQEVSASQAVAFIFIIKRLIRAEFRADSERFQDELSALEARADEMALSAFDLFMKCRERIYEIKANETRRSVFLSERIRSKEADAPAGNPADEAR
jgi:hypothetical protein